MRCAARRDHEDGYAIVAAVGAIAVVAVMALTVLTMARVAVESGSATIGRARAAAAADAGTALALSGLIAPDRATRWSLDGRARRLPFGDAQLTIRIEDEQGKVPINRLDTELVANLIAEVGLTGQQARVAADSLLDWLDDDDEPRPDGAEADYYAPRGIRPRNGGVLSVGEVAEVRGWDQQSASQLPSFTTINIGNNPFRPDNASPAAIRVMLGRNSPQAIQREREARGQVTAIDLDDRETRVGRPVTIVVESRLPDGASAQRRTTIELTGAPTRPYVVLESR